MMVILYILLISVWISDTNAQTEGPTFTEEQLASSPLIRQLLERVEALEKTGARQEDEIRQLKSQTVSLKAEMVQQKAEMAQMRHRSSAKNKTIQHLLRMLSRSKEKNASMDKSLSRTASTAAANSPGYREQRKSVEKTNRIRRAENEVIVAFTAGLSQHMTQVGANQYIIFDHVITNVGNAYNPHHGVFVAPVSGIYIFSTSILSYDSRNNWASITVNGVEKTRLFMHDDSHAMSSQTVALDLNQGDDVAIKGHPNDAYYGERLPYTTFTGFLLQQSFTNIGNVVG